MTETTPLSAFTAVGVELEYMIVDQETLKILPIADQLFQKVTGESPPSGDHETGWVNWSNELANHVIEIKNERPDKDLNQLQKGLQAQVNAINEQLGSQFGAKLLPTAMHPLMDPKKDSELWPHGDRRIYSTYDRIFGCSGHGWTNLQSVHINLPFADEEEFVALHEAIRCILPLIPALAASSPICEGVASGWVDTRLRYYMNNQAKIPSLTGQIVPEPLRSFAAYHNMLEGLYKDIRPHDSENLLQKEWLNSRGAIARFDRNAIEIRVMDIQESPRADMALVTLITRTLQALYKKLRASTQAELSKPFLQTENLKKLVLLGAEKGHSQKIEDLEYLRFVLSDPGLNSELSFQQLWLELLDCAAFQPSEFALQNDAKKIIQRGCLSHALMQEIEPKSDESLIQTYQQLSHHLDKNLLFGI